MHTTKPVSHPTDLGRNSQELTQCTSQLVPELGPWSLALTYKDSWKRHENLPGGKSWRIPLSRCDSALLFAFIFAFILCGEGAGEGPAAQHLSRDLQPPRALLQAGWAHNWLLIGRMGILPSLGAQGASWLLYGLHTDKQSTPSAEAAVTDVPRPPRKEMNVANEMNVQQNP